MGDVLEIFDRESVEWTTAAALVRNGASVRCDGCGAITKPTTEAIATMFRRGKWRACCAGQKQWLSVGGPASGPIDVTHGEEE